MSGRTSRSPTCHWAPGLAAGSWFLAKQRHWLDVRRLPAYAPELNPVEGLWSNLKSQELANRCEAHVQMVTIAARQGANRVRSQRSLLLGFLRHTGLQL